jgi:uncharacterized protein (TIGR00299 family) protein
LRVRFERRQRGGFAGRGFVVTWPERARGRGRGKAAQPAAKRVQHVHRAGHDHDHLHDGDHGHAHGGDAPHAADHVHRDYAEIRRLLRRAKLDADAKALAEEIFSRVAEVEAALHGTSIDRVAFHEVGAFDSIADIVGASAAIAWLAPRSIGSSAPVVGTGTVHTAHGVLPVPAPATAALLHGVAVRAEGEGELTTPTGAAILAAIVDRFGAPPPMQLRAVGYGAGTRDLEDRPNVLRVMLGAPVGAALGPAADEVLLLETNIDDMSGQLLAALFEALFEAGAVDVWATPIIMKKGRPAHQVSALVEPLRAAHVERAFFLNSTTLGLRKRMVERATLARSIAPVATPYGEVRLKVAGLDGEVIGAEPEFEDVRRRARASGAPLRRVWAAAAAVAVTLGPSPPRTGRPPSGARGPRRRRA